MSGENWAQTVKQSSDLSKKQLEKQLGKTLIVVSHDDSYFRLADRLLQMQNGRLIELTAEVQVQASQEAVAHLRKLDQVLVDVVICLFYGQACRESHLGIKTSNCGVGYSVKRYNRENFPKDLDHASSLVSENKVFSSLSQRTNSSSKPHQYQLRCYLHYRTYPR